MKKETKTEDVFDYKTIKTPEDGFKRKGIDFSKLPDVSSFPEEFREGMLNLFILIVVISAVNDKWVPDHSKHNQPKYFPYGWVSSSGLSFSDSYYYFGSAYASVGSCLCLESPEKALYVFNQFPDLWKGWLLNVKKQ